MPTIRVEVFDMKQRLLGVLAAAIAFVSLVLPWWVLKMSIAQQTIDVVFYPWGVSGNLSDILGSAAELWWAYLTMALVIVGGVLELIGVLVIEKGRKTLLSASGLLSLLSLVVFTTGLTSTLSRKFPGVTIFYFGPYFLWHISAYLSLGFWLELIASILSFVASSRYH